MLLFQGAPPVIVNSLSAASNQQMNPVFPEEKMELGFTSLLCVCISWNAMNIFYEPGILSKDDQKKH